MYRALVITGICLAATAAAAPAQSADPHIVHRVLQPGETNLSGPRVGVTFLPDRAVDRIRDRYGVSGAISQIGWQMEHRFFAVPQGPAGLAELTLLAGAAEKGEFIPSAMLLFGVRSKSGFEVAAGAQGNPVEGTAVFQAGFTLSAGYLRFPMIVQVMPGAGGTRVGFLTGFNALR